MSLSTTKRGKQRRKPKRQLEERYLTSLNRMIDQLYQSAYDQKMTWDVLAKRSGLAVATIQRLAARQTQLLQYRTIELLAQALGGTVKFSKRSNRIMWTLKLFKKPRVKKVAA